MRTKLIVVLSLILLVLGGCETRTFEYVTTVSKTMVYTVDQSGAFTETNMVSADELNDEFDLPEDAIIGDIFIEALTVAVEPLTDNEATAITMDGYANGRLFVDDLVTDMTAGDYEFTNMANLLASGVRAIGEDLAAYYRTGSPPTVEFRLEGDTHPEAGERIHIRIQIGMTLSLQYALETEFPAI